MEIQISTKLQPFPVPESVVQDGPPRPRQGGFQQRPVFLLSELEPETLAALCAEFRATVFTKAGKADPAVQPTP